MSDAAVSSPGGLAGILVGGRVFRPSAKPTYRQRLYMRRQVFAAGLHDVGQQPTPQALAEAVMAKVTAAGCEPELLAGWLVERGAEWSEESAQANIAFFANLTEPADMDVLDGALLPLLFGFLNGKLSSPATSPDSSTAGETDTPISEPPAPPAMASS